MVLSICSHNITLNGKGAPCSGVSLPLSLTAHMTQAAAAHYTFSCDGTAPLPHFTPLSQNNLFRSHLCILCILLLFLVGAVFSVSVVPLLSWTTVPSLFCHLNVHTAFAKQLLVSKHSVCAASYSVTPLHRSPCSNQPLVHIYCSCMSRTNTELHQ